MESIAVLSRGAFRTYVAQILASGPPIKPYALISFRDPLVNPVDAPGCTQRLDLICHDVGETISELPGPTPSQAAQIVAFVRALQAPHLIVQCEIGVGRSVATAAAILQAMGCDDYSEALAKGTHNRRLYKMLAQEFGLPVQTEPLVALAVRIKYPWDRFATLLNSLRRQRYGNWKLVAVSDGPPGSAGRVPPADDWELIETPVKRGLWGHPYRQLGIDRCLELGAQYVGLSNDDNYYVPGYLEQMIGTMTRERADFSLCQTVHSYLAWGVMPATPQTGFTDVGNWLAAAQLIRQVPFVGTDVFSDGVFVEQLAAKAQRIVTINKPLFIKN